MPDLRIIIGNQLSKNAAETVLTLEELISQMKESGMDNSAIKSVLMNDLNTGGRLFGTYRNNVKNTVKNGANMVANETSRKEFEEAGIKEYRWVSIGDNRVCPDCEPRNGEVNTMEFFKTIGLPRSGFSICRSNCRCQLVPEEYKDEDFSKPLLRKENINKPKKFISEKVFSSKWSSSKSHTFAYNAMAQKQIKAIEEYTSGYANSIVGGYGSKNAYLRTGKIPKHLRDAVKVSEMVGFVENIDGALANSVADNDFTVYRGVTEVSPLLGIKNSEDIQPGMTFKHNAYVSTSRKRSVADKFAEKLNYWEDPHVFVYKIKKGQNALPMDLVDPNYLKHEAEVLLPRDTKFKITSKKGNVITCEMID